MSAPSSAQIRVQAEVTGVVGAELLADGGHGQDGQVVAAGLVDQPGQAAECLALVLGADED